MRSASSVDVSMGVCVMKKSFCFLVILLAFTLGMPTAHAHDTCAIPDLSSVRRVVDNHVCTNEYDKAVLMGNDLFGQPLHNDVATLWGGSPFVVNVSSVFYNAFELLDIVDAEAERIRQAIGYRVVVAGNVLELPWVSGNNADQALMWNAPPDGQIYVFCCNDDPDALGYAQTPRRLMVLNRNPEDAAGAIIHELWHLLGFHHPGERDGVTMSRPLNNTWPTSSAAQDLAGLACVFDEANDHIGGYSLYQTVSTEPATDWGTWEQEQEAWWQEHQETLAEAEQELHETFCESDFFDPPAWCDDLGDLYP